MKQKLIDLGEKTAATFVEVFLTAFIGSQALGIDSAQAAGLAGVAAALTVVADGAMSFDLSGNGWDDIAGRGLRTAVVGFVSYLVAAPILDLSTEGLKVAALSVIPAVLAVVKSGLAARFVGVVGTGALLPPKYDPANVVTVA